VKKDTIVQKDHHDPHYAEVTVAYHITRHTVQSLLLDVLMFSFLKQFELVTGPIIVCMNHSHIIFVLFIYSCGILLDFQFHCAKPGHVVPHHPSHAQAQPARGVSAGGAHHPAQ